MSKAQEFPERGGGVDSMNFFFSSQSQYYFQTVVCKVSLFAFYFLSHGRKKINLANLKHKMHISELVWLNILSPLESDHFPE